MVNRNTRLGARLVLMAIASAIGACAIQPSEPMVKVAAPGPVLAERFISVEELNQLALSMPRPPPDVSEFEKAVTHLLRDHAPDWPRAAERARETAPKDVYSVSGYDYLVLVDEGLAQKVKDAPNAEAKAAACRERCPATCALLERATRDMVTSKYKPFPRPRPIGERHDSYPSGHAAQAVLQCRLLWEVVRPRRPEVEETLLREAYARAMDRVVIAIHHPSDVAAGLAFGLAAAKKIIDADTPAFHSALEAARKEW